MKILTFFLSFAIGLILTPLIIKLAIKKKLFDHPYSSPLKTHKKATPYLGGASIYIALLVSSIYINMYYINSTKISGILICGSLVFLLGLVDDIKKLSIPAKFFFEILIALLLILVFDIKIKFLPDVFNIPLSAIWIVGMINALNIIDIMDGLAGGVSVISSFIFGIILFDNGMVSEGVLAYSLCGGAVGFLVYNFPRARIFLGDAGSLFIGFILGSLAMAGRYSTNNVVSVLAPLCILAVPLFDTFFVMIMRAKQQKVMFYGSNDHFPLRLEKIGWSRQKVVVFIYVVAIMLGLISYISVQLPFIFAVFVYLLLFLFVLLCGYSLSKVKM